MVQDINTLACQLQQGQGIIKIGKRRIF